MEKEVENQEILEKDRKGCPVTLGKSIYISGLHVPH